MIALKFFSPRFFSLALSLIISLGLVSSCRKSSEKALTKNESTESASVKEAPLPLIDSHVHITPIPEILNLALQIFSQTGVQKFAVKSAGTVGEPRYVATKELAQTMGERMAFFSNPDWEDIDDPQWGKREAAAIVQTMADGGSGIKIFKALGLGVRLKNGKLLRIDDPRLEPLWRAAGESKAIVAWHVADPVAFFKPITPKNERYDELSLAPDWSFYGKDFPSFDELMAQQKKIVKTHPQTIFLGIHLAGYSENLDWVGQFLDECPNLYVDISARVPEIGRHPPDKARTFFIKYQDRILFGTDLIVTPNGMQLGSVSPTPPNFEDALKYYAIHRRYFETADRNFDHPTPIQGRWQINGINLPRAVLKKIYYDNADRLIFKARREWLAKHPTNITP